MSGDIPGFATVQLTILNLRGLYASSSLLKMQAIRSAMVEQHASQS